MFDTIEKYHILTDKNGKPKLEKFIVTMVNDIDYSLKLNECKYKVISPEKFKDEVWCWWAFEDSYEQANKDYVKKSLEYEIFNEVNKVNNVAAKYYLTSFLQLIILTK